MYVFNIIKLIIVKLLKDFSQFLIIILIIDMNMIPEVSRRTVFFNKKKLLKKSILAF